MRTTVKVGFIGAGNMAAALVGGMINKGLAPDDVLVFDPDEGKTNMLRHRFAIGVAGNNTEILGQCDVVVLAVKPQVMRDVLTPLAAGVPDTPPLIISVAAGIRVPSIEEWLGRPLSVIRVMPNTPALVGAGASGLYANERVSAEQRRTAETLMQSVGVTAWVENEPQLDTVTGIAGSGPAYFMQFMEAMVEAAEAGRRNPCHYPGRGERRRGSGRRARHYAGKGITKGHTDGRLRQQRRTVSGRYDLRPVHTRRSAALSAAVDAGGLL